MRPSQYRHRLRRLEDAIPSPGADSRPPIVLRELHALIAAGELDDPKARDREAQAAVWLGARRRHASGDRRGVMLERLRELVGGEDDGA